MVKYTATNVKPKTIIQISILYEDLISQYRIADQV